MKKIKHESIELIKIVDKRIFRLHEYELVWIMIWYIKDIIFVNWYVENYII
jgi:hypothetical protein